MNRDNLPPVGCIWWALGDVTLNPPEDEHFLSKLAEAGFATYVGSRGLVGARTRDRSVVVIHRGFGRRWELTLREDGIDRHITKVTRLPERAQEAIAWLNGESLDNVRLLLEAVIDPAWNDERYRTIHKRKKKDG